MVDLTTESTVVDTTGVMGSSSRISSSDGFESFAFAQSLTGVSDGDTIRVEYDKTTDQFTVTNTTTSQVATAAGPSEAPAAGQFTDIAVPEFDLTIRLNENFNPNSNNKAPTGNPSLNEFTVVTTSMTTTTTVNARDFTYKVGTGGASAADDIRVTLQAATVSNLDAGLATAELNTVAAATATEANVDAAIANVDDARRSVAGMKERFDVAGGTRAIDQGVLRKDLAALSGYDEAAAMAEAMRDQPMRGLSEVLFTSALKGGR